MNDVRAAPPVRPNLWAGRLTSYAFSVEAAIGQNPMRYLLARRFDQTPPTRALTMLFVIEPRVLFGTYVRIDETLEKSGEGSGGAGSGKHGAAGGDCVVHTFLPTMARPLAVGEGRMFDCLPLTDVGYVDIMAWPHPGLRARPAAAPRLDSGAGPGAPATAAAARKLTREYAGPPSVPALTVREVVDVEYSMVVSRIFYHSEEQIRRWEIMEPGGRGQETLPLRIRVSRPQTRHGTEFVRASVPVVVPRGIFDAEPARLCDWIEQRLIDADAP